MSMSVHQGERAACDGFVLVAVLWILSAFAALAAIYSIYVANTAVAVAGSDDAIEAEALMSASVELTAYQLIDMPEESRPTRGAFNFRLGRANVAVEFCSEAARIRRRRRNTQTGSLAGARRLKPVSATRKPRSIRRQACPTFRAARPLTM